MFSWPNKWENASFGRNEKSVELAQKNLADLHFKFFMQPQNKKTSCAVKKKKKHYMTASVLKNKIAQRRLKNISRGFFTTDVGYWVFNSIRERNLHDVG